MNRRDTIKELLAIHLKNELVSYYEEKGFESSAIGQIINREKRNKTFINESEKLVADFEKEVISNELESLLTKIQSENKSLYDKISMELGDLKYERDDDLSDKILNLQTILNRTNLNSLISEISALKLEQSLLKGLKVELDRLAIRKASKYSVIYFVLNLLAISSWIILINVYTWDLVEPFTWIYGLTIVFIVNFSYNIWGYKLAPDQMIRNRMEKIKNSLYQRHKFSPEQLDIIEEKIRACEANHSIHNNLTDYSSE
ncbi:MAG: hypothetical protein R8G66_01315 [Cytophagales bacterium]|nr:hypothetical protein [Cytophagales bacterium]